MSIKINCENRNRKRRIDSALVIKAARFVLRQLKIKNAELNIVFLSNQKIRAINHKFLGRDRATDVIAFPGEKNFLGDIAISSDKAAQNAVEYGTSPKEEEFLYVIHGILHLAGYDDRAKRKNAVMRKKEDEIFRKIKRFF